MKCRNHLFGADGKCPKCGKRRPGRPKHSKRPPESADVPAVAEPKGDALPASLPIPPVESPRAGDIRAERAARLQSLFSPPPPVVVAPPESEPEPEPEPENTIPIERHDWKWAAGIATEGIDVGAGWAIGAWSDIEPLEASESSRKRFAATLATFGEQRLGKIEVPTWIILVVCLVALITSKMLGAPRKAKSRKPETAPTALRDPATTADASPPDAATAVVSPVTPPPPPSVPPPEYHPPIADGGSVPNAPIGF